MHKLLSIAVALAFAGSAWAQSGPAAPYTDKPRVGARADGTPDVKPSVDRKARKAEHDRIEADYKAAKAKYERAKADIKARFASKERKAATGSTSK